MSILKVNQVTKRYHNHVAVDEVSFAMPPASILGLLGPNGAGKTSLIRIITTITRADSGNIHFNGELLNTSHPEEIGYLPEERGLYKKMKVGEQLIYLAQLKGLSYTNAKSEIEHWLEKFDITSWWSKKIEELSKGMQQKVQFISTVVHKPKLIILDEPFSGLDPINTKLIKQEIRKLHQDGTSIIFSTHRMEQVEEICEHIVLIDKGKNILEGNVSEIKDQYKDHLFKIAYTGDLTSSVLEHTAIKEQTDNMITVQFGKLEQANYFMKSMMDQGVMIERFEEILPTLNDIFIKKVTEAL